MSTAIDTITGKRARDKASAQMAEAEERTRRIQQRESARLAEAKSDVVLKKAMSGRSKLFGRRSLIATGNRGVTRNQALGGS